MCLLFFDTSISYKDINLYIYYFFDTNPYTIDINIKYVYYF